MMSRLMNGRFILGALAAVTLITVFGVMRKPRQLGAITATTYSDDERLPINQRLKTVPVTAKQKANIILMDQIAKRGYWSESDDSYEKMTAREREQVNDQMEKQATRLAKVLGYTKAWSG